MDIVSLPLSLIYSEVICDSAVLNDSSSSQVLRLPDPLPIMEQQNALVTISIVLGLISSVAVIVSVIIAYCQWKKSKKFDGVKHVQLLREKLCDDKEVAVAILWFDYDFEWYSDKFHSDMETQRKIDKTLSVLEYACYLKDKRFINDEQFSLVKYIIDRTITNFQVQEYLYNLYHWTEKCGTEMSFSFLLKYGKNKGVIDSEFDNNKSKRYRHFLNF